MPTFSTLSGLSAYIKKSAKDVLLDDVAKMASKSLKDSKQKNVYDAYSPTEYQRTYEFLNSNPSVFNDKKSTKDKFYLKTYTETDTTFMPSKHPSWLGDGRSNKNRFIPQWMEEGNGNSPIFSYGARPYIMDAWREVDRNLKLTLIKGLSKKGIASH